MESVNTNSNTLQAVIYQRTNYANWTKSPTEFDDCERCGYMNYHSYLYRCFGCDVLHCTLCIAPDPVFVYEFGDFISIFCCVECKNKHMNDKHPALKDCEECHMMFPSAQFQKLCEKCVNGVCRKCTKKIAHGDMLHTHLEWEDRLMQEVL
jgi:hypothetical protein